MLQFPTFTLTAEINLSLKRIETNQILIENLPVDPSLHARLVHTSILKSSLFSARIEGNKLTLSQITKDDLEASETKEKVEIRNLLRAIETVPSLNSPLKISDIAFLHEIAMKNLTSDAGKLRSEQTAIFDISGNAVYVTPPVSELPLLLETLLSQLNQFDAHPAIQAGLTHYFFEKVHPFVDGNGRVGRLLINWLLQTRGFAFKNLVSLEEYIDEHKSLYYSLLQPTTTDATAFAKFILEGLAFESDKIVTLLKHPPKQTTNLLPRREEILNIVRDHDMVSFDFLSRRFPSVKPSTLHFDIQQLLKGGYIKKLGTTRAARYSLAEKI
jgi:Fic family protein